MADLTCSHCKAPFTARRAHALTCSNACRMAASRAARPKAKADSDRAKNAAAMKAQYERTKALEKAGRLERWALLEAVGYHQSKALEDALGR